MFHAKYHSLLVTFFMALFMSGAMSLAMSLLHFEGGWKGLAFSWLSAWGVSFMVALPVTFLITPFVLFIVNALLAKSDSPS